MKTRVWAYVVIIVLSLGAGVANAGIPTFEARDPTIQSPSVTTTTLPESNDATTEPVTSGSGDDTEPSADATDSDSAADTAAFDSTTSSTSSTTTTSTTTSTTTVPLADRDALQVAMVNGAGVGGAATNGSAALEAAGYVDVGSFDGSEILDVTVVFATGAASGEAARLVEEIGIAPELVFPIDTAPDVPGLGKGVQLMVYLGRDVVAIPFFD